MNQDHLSFGRRQFLQTTALAAATAGLGLYDAAPAAAQGAPKRGGNFTFAISAETPHYDAHGSDTFATLHFGAPFYSTLLQFNLADYPKVKGDLAASWDVAADLMTYTFKLTPNVTFHDGTALTSADVKATYDRMRNPPTGVVSTRRATFGDIDTIETPDPLTIVFKMKTPNPAMLEHFASPWNWIYAAKDLAAKLNLGEAKVAAALKETAPRHGQGEGRRGDHGPRGAGGPGGPPPMVG